MLATHTIDPENLYTISAGGFSATADAFARDDKTESLWFVSMVGSQTALKAIWASLLKQPPDVAHIIKGADGMALSGGYQRCQVPYETIGTWTTKIARLRGTGGWHALVQFEPIQHHCIWILDPFRAKRRNGFDVEHLVESAQNVLHLHAEVLLAMAATEAHPAPTRQPALPSTCCPR